MSSSRRSRQSTATAGCAGLLLAELVESFRRHCHFFAQWWSMMVDRSIDRQKKKASSSAESRNAPIVALFISASRRAMARRYERKQRRRTEDAFSKRGPPKRIHAPPRNAPRMSFVRRAGCFFACLRRSPPAVKAAAANPFLSLSLCLSRVSSWRCDPIRPDKTKSNDVLQCEQSPNHPPRGRVERRDQGQGQYSQRRG